MSNSEMVERVAQAIAARMGQCPCTDQDCARAAIEAMREPTDAMLNAKAPTSWEERAPINGSLEDHCAASIWRAMIDEALK